MQKSQSRSKARASSSRQGASSKSKRRTPRAELHSTAEATASSLGQGWHQEPGLAPDASPDHYRVRFSASYLPEDPLEFDNPSDGLDDNLEQPDYTADDDEPTSDVDYSYGEPPNEPVFEDKVEVTADGLADEFRGLRTYDEAKEATKTGEWANRWDNLGYPEKYHAMELPQTGWVPVNEHPYLHHRPQWKTSQEEKVPGAFHACFLSFLLTWDKREQENDLQLGPYLRAYQLLCAVILADQQNSSLAKVPAMIEGVEADFKELRDHSTATIKFRHETNPRHIEWDRDTPAKLTARAVQISHITEVLNHRNELTFTLDRHFRKNSLKAVLAGIRQKISALQSSIRPKLTVLESPESAKGLVTWELDEPLRQETDSVNEAEFLSPNGGVEEVEFVDTPMKPAPWQDQVPGGRFRGIVKLRLTSLHDQTKVSGGGTGWLVDSQTIVTAGHCVHNRAGQHLISVTATIGFPDHQPEKRFGAAVAVQWGWFKQFDRRHDLAVIRVTKPFSNSCVCYPHMLCPSKGEVKVFVAGFPGIRDNRPKGVLYYNPHREKLGLPDAVRTGVLKHKQSTLPGHSGSPVFVGKSSGLSVIGVHTSGLENEFNSAVIFKAASREGNHLSSMVEFLDHHMAENRTRDFLYLWAWNGPWLCTFDWSPCRSS